MTKHFINKSLWSSIVLRLVLPFQLQKESAADWSLLEQQSFPRKCSHRVEECQDEICIKIPLSQRWVSKAAIRSFPCHKGSLHLNLTWGSLLEGNQGWEYWFSSVIFAMLKENHEWAWNKLLYPSLLTNAQCLTVARYSRLKRKRPCEWQNYAHHKTLVC